MALTSKDALTTVLAAASVGVYYVVTKGIHIPLINSYRGASVAVLIIGIIMCSSGSYNLSAPGAWTTPWAIISMTLGIASFVFAIIGVISGSRSVFIVLEAVLLLLWIATTVRHAIIT